MSVSFEIPEDLSMETLLNEGELQVSDIRKGSTITGRIVKFQDDAAIVDMGSKSEGRISLREFDEKPAIGDSVEAIIRNIDNQTGLVQLSKRELEQRRGWEIVKEYFEKEKPVAGEVKRAMKAGYLVHIEGLPMLLPHSLIGLLSERHKKGKKLDIIGSTFSFKIVSIDARRRTGILSRKDFQNEQNQQHWKTLIENTRIGDIVTGKVVTYTKAGAFIDVMGVEGFLHKSNISWERKNDNFREKLPIDSEIQVRVLEIDTENNRLSLGLKQLTSDPWGSVMEKFNVGDKVKGVVSFVANYGAFIDLGEGLEGLLHISEMSWTRKINHAQEMLKVGQELETQIIGINPEDKRISLGLRQMQQNPWDQIRSELRVGQVIKSKIKDVTSFGAFVVITPEIDGLVRKEDLNWDEPAPDPKKLYKSGDEVEFRIIEIDLENRKIGCSIRHLLPNPYKELKEKYPRGMIVDGIVTGVVDFGIFVRFEEKYEGLVHLSAMGREESSNHKKIYKKGDSVRVVIKNIDPENRKISLSVKDVENAMQRIEMQQYLEKENNASAPTQSPFASLRSK
ncbi:MAG: 30S ribosomal protein S1 [Leptospiraceae bacterium]|nr:30S ribosomal protein S1 [Leptospiraceae bacterium]